MSMNPSNQEVNKSQKEVRTNEQGSNNPKLQSVNYVTI